MAFSHPNEWDAHMRKRLMQWCWMLDGNGVGSVKRIWQTSLIPVVLVTALSDEVIALSGWKSALLIASANRFVRAN